MLHELQWRRVISPELAKSAFRRLHKAPIRVRKPARLRQQAWEVASRLGWAKTYPGPALPQAVVAGTRARYIEAFERLTGLGFERYRADPSIVLR